MEFLLIKVSTDKQSNLKIHYSISRRLTADYYTLIPVRKADYLPCYASDIWIRLDILKLP
jgi:hypothetical protein